MKKILNIIFKKSVVVLSAMVVSLSSCSDFFQEPIAMDTDNNDIFDSMQNAEKALNAAYALMPYNWPYAFGSGATPWINKAKLSQDIIATICDEAVTTAGWTGAVNFYYGNGKISPAIMGMKGGATQFIEYIFEEPYYGFRKAYLFLENVSSVPITDPTWVAESKAQAQLLIAIGYYELIKRHGSVPWVTSSLNIDDDLSTCEKRPPLKELINNVDNLIVEALEYLPDSQDYDSANFGRVTKSAAHFLRARLWLLAASPLFNTDQPYLPTENPELICMMNGDEESQKAVWTKAKEVTSAAIAYCTGEGGHAMKKLNSTIGRSPSDYTEADYEAAKDLYHLATRDVYNSEGRNNEVVMFSRRVKTAAGGNPGSAANNFFGKHMPPRPTDGSGRSGYCGVTQNMVDMYLKRGSGEASSESDYNTSNPWKDLDPRFHASIIYDGAEFGAPNPVTIYTNDVDPWIVTDPSKNQTGWKTGYYLRKFFHADQYSNSKLQKDMVYIYMRLPELYLNMAEILNELNPSDPEIQTNLNVVTSRVLMPNRELPKTKEGNRDVIRNERAVELAFEDHRYFDVKRWKIAGTTIGAKKFGAVRTGDAGAATKYTKTPCPADRQTTWHDKYYLDPFPLSEVQKGYGLIQNPGY